LLAVELSGMLITIPSMRVFDFSLQEFSEFIPRLAPMSLGRSYLDESK
jgi:hypothetical protein